MRNAILVKGTTRPRLCTEVGLVFLWCYYCCLLPQRLDLAGPADQAGEFGNFGIIPQDG